MPPRVKKSVPENAEKKASLNAAKQKILDGKRSTLQIVEMLLEKNISEECFLKNVEKLSQADYKDVIEERNIECLCGFPVCSNSIKMTKQQYYIFPKSRKVYDITKRKCFCSDKCYEASNYVQNQLSTEPCWKQERSCKAVELLPDFQNRGSRGEEVIFFSASHPEEIKKPESSSSALSKMLHEDVKQCAQELENLKIEEKIYDLEESSSDSDDSFSLEYDSSQVAFFPQMPARKEHKPAVLIPAVAAPPLPLHSRPSLEWVESLFKDWMTEDSIKYLLGEKTVFSVKADLLLKAQNTEQLKEKYMQLCLALDHSEDVKPTGEAEESVLPPVDSLSQNVLQRKILLRRLKIVYIDFLQSVGLRYPDISQAIQELVQTFSLTSHNIIFKPPEMKLLSLVLFRILSKTVLLELDKTETFQNLVQQCCADISLETLDNFVMRMVDPHTLLSQ